MAELAIDVNGDPFDVPDHITGWRVRRLQPDGRGRPELVYDAMGKPVVLPVGASFAELHHAVGPGRYRLDPVDASGRADAKVATACTGYLQPIDPESGAPRMPSGPAHAASEGAKPATAPAGEIERILCATIEANTRLAGMVLSQFSGMIGAAGQLIAAADGASITTRQPLPALPPAASPSEADDDSAPVSSVPPWLDTLIGQAAAALVPALLAKLPSLPLGALLDWSKAAPSASTEPPGPSVPTRASAPPSPTASSAADPPIPPHAPHTPLASAAPRQYASSMAHAHAPASSAMAAVTATSAAKPANVEPSGESAETSTAPAARSPDVPADRQGPADNTAITAHMQQVWASLTPAEQARATQLVAALTAEERAHWIVELSGMTIPDATERVRSVLWPHAPETGGAS